MQIRFYKMLLLITVLLLSNVGLFAQVNWTKYPGNPLDSLNGEPGSWHRNVHTSSVIYNPDSSRFEMWFTGEVYDGPPFRIGFAWSLNGINWTIHPDPVLTPTPGTWDAVSVMFPCVILENGVYKMWYCGYSQFPYYKIGYATSPNGINWFKDTLHNPIFGAGIHPWESAGICAVSVIPVEGGYKIWYEAAQLNSPNNARIGYATSVDEINWVRDTLHNPVLDLGSSGQWDDAYIFMPNVLYIDSLYYMFYGGGRAGLVNRAIGLATSANGITQWTKYAQNPVLTKSTGEWDGQWVQISRLLLVGDSLYMWYTGTRYPLTTYLWRTGLAKSNFEPVSVDEQKTLPSEFILSQNYPNPFNPGTKISWQSPVGSNLTIKLFDVLGNEIATLIDEYKPAGRYEVEFNAADLPSGIYFYQLKAGNFTDTKKMTILK